MIIIKSKLIRFIICGLLVILTITSFHTYNLYQKSKINKQLYIRPQQEQSIKVIDKQVIIEKLNKENKIVCLSGTITVQAEFLDKQISDQDTNFKWFKDKLHELQAKSIKVEVEVQFDFTYDLTNLPISIHNNTITISVSPNRLSLNKCQIVENKSIYNEQLGILSKQFTPQQMNSINLRIKQLAKNKILSDEDMRTKALENVKSNIIDLIKPISNNTYIDFKEYSYDVISQENNIILKGVKRNA